MRRIVHWPDRQRLVYLHEKATPEYWDSTWEKEGPPPLVGSKDDVVTVTREYLEQGAKVLEGGCGRANKVKAMADAGFNALGIDFGEETVRRAKRHYPELDIRNGDVRALDLENDSLDGYWSIGVIEHFWAGYDQIIAEAARVLKPNGYLFLTAPWFSPLRQKKALSGGYPTDRFTNEPSGFYQFALGQEEVLSQLDRHGFDVLRWRGRVSEISLKDDATKFRKPIDWLFGRRGSIAKRVLRKVVARSLDQYCGHSFLAIAKRE